MNSTGSISISKEANNDYLFADGRVIAVDPLDKYGNFTIDTGSLAGVEPNDPVITPSGLVGVVYEVGPPGPRYDPCSIPLPRPAPISARTATPVSPAEARPWRRTGCCGSTCCPAKPARPSAISP